MLRVLRHYFPIRKALLVLGEMLILTAVLAVAFSYHLWEPERSVLEALTLEAIRPREAILRCCLSAFFLAVLAQIAIAFNELYDFRVSSSRYARSARFLEAVGTSLLVTLGTLLVLRAWGLREVLFFPGIGLARQMQVLVFALIVGFMLLLLYRVVFHWLLRRANLNERVLILGSGKAAHILASEILERPGSGYEVCGIVPDAGGESRPRGQRIDEPGWKAPAHDFLGGLDPAVEWNSGGNAAATQALVLERPTLHVAKKAQPKAALGNGNGNGHDHVRENGTTSRRMLRPGALLELVEELNVHVVVVALQDRRRALPTEELLKCRLAGITVREKEALYERITGKIAVEALRPSYLIFNDGFRRHPWAVLLKRVVDILLSLVILSLTWPVMLAAAIAVRLDSPGPILFSQERVGRDGTTFTLFKFRSMRQDAEKGTGPVWAKEGDPRITRCGRFLRKSRIDELPQLFNVLVGNMSLVGPRPERPMFVDDLSHKIPYYGQRHILEPGVTGWAQINYPYGNTVEDALQKLQYDLFYIKNQSLIFDLSILLNTIKTVLLRKGT